MGFAAFMTNPTGYLGHHRAEISYGAPARDALTETVGDPLGNGKVPVRFAPRAGRYITMIHAVGIHDAVHSSKLAVFKAVTGISGPIHRTFQPIASGNDVGLRYLPFRENHITYMALDRAARFFLTGPLSGCTVAVARHNGVLWTFHSNDNVGAGAAARNTQAQSIREVREGLMIPGNAVHLCEYQTAYDGLGFVFGKADDAGRWKFYAHATSVGGATATRKWAEIR